MSVRVLVGDRVAVGVNVGTPLVKSMRRLGRTDAECSRLSKRLAVAETASLPLSIQPKLVGG